MPLNHDPDPTVLFAQAMHRLADNLDATHALTAHVVQMLQATIRIAWIACGLTAVLGFVLLGLLAYYAISGAAHHQALVQGLTEVLRRTTP
jgi:uncharacterized membrane protein YukC